MHCRLTEGWGPGWVDQRFERPPGSLHDSKIRIYILEFDLLVFSLFKESQADFPT